MKRTFLTWTTFAAALALVLTVMLFFTVRMLQFERDINAANSRAGVEENIRLALWRMDSAAALMLAHKKRVVLTNPGNNKMDNAYQNVSQQRSSLAYQNDLSRQELQQREQLIAPEPANWHKLEPMLLERISDLFPDARLAPLDSKDIKPDDTRRLASIPAQLVVPAAAFNAPPLPWNTPLRISLIIAWICAIIASAAVAVLLRGALLLSDRRGAFVSAVTHELRTPLTTFRMYSEMLAGGMVAGPESRQQYLDTLVSESDRLGHLIENVLAYARLERQLSPSRAQTIRVSDLVERALPALQRRTQQAGLKLNVALVDSVADKTFATDTIAVQQILLNLVDNACKYGRTDISLAVRSDVKNLEFAVSDQGPGLDPAASSRLFKAFSKSRTDTVPGIGLGLFLSRRLARDLGGDLRYVEANPGAMFVLALPS